MTKQEFIRQVKKIYTCVSGDEIWVDYLNPDKRRIDAIYIYAPDQWLLGDCESIDNFQNINNSSNPKFYQSVIDHLSEYDAQCNHLSPYEWGEYKSQSGAHINDGIEGYTDQADINEYKRGYDEARL